MSPSMFSNIKTNDEFDLSLDSKKLDVSVLNSSSGDKKPYVSSPKVSKSTIKYSYLKDKSLQLAKRVLSLVERANKYNNDNKIHICSLTLTGECKKISFSKKQIEFHVQRFHPRVKDAKAIQVLIPTLNINN